MSLTKTTKLTQHEERIAKLAAQQAALEKEMADRMKALKERIEKESAEKEVEEKRVRKARALAIGMAVQANWDVFGGEKRLMRLLDDVVANKKDRATLGLAPREGQADDESDAAAADDSTASAA